jgi:hypothetical protein
MRAKKIMFLAVLTLVLVLVLVATGTALAAPPGSEVPLPMRVTGNIALTGITEGDYFFPTERTWALPLREEFYLDGDLVGTLVENAVMHGAIPWYGHYALTGTGTFEGTLRGKPTSFTFDLKGGWGYDNESPDVPRGGPAFVQRGIFIITSGSAGPVLDLTGTIQGYARYIGESGSSTYWGVIR